jgi:hypothetical protein
MPVICNTTGPFDIPRTVRNLQILAKPHATFLAMLPGNFGASAYLGSVNTLFGLLGRSECQLACGR